METCPKCNFALAPEAVECPACGVILAKLKAVAGLQRPLRPVPAALPSNPYAPPTAEIGNVPLPPPLPAVTGAPAQDVITRPTVEALQAARPWIRFLSIYGFVAMSITLVSALGLLLFGMDKPQTIPIAIFYLLYGLVGFALLRPLHRSSTALGRLSLGASACLETFAKEQSAFWRLSGVIGIVTLVIVGLGVAMALLAGSLLTS